MAGKKNKRLATQDKIDTPLVSVGRKKLTQKKTVPVSKTGARRGK